LGPASDLTYPASMKDETSAVVEANGHLIDSGLLNTIFDAVITIRGAKVRDRAHQQ
jgi:hypothetical protein